MFRVCVCTTWIADLAASIHFVPERETVFIREGDNLHVKCIADCYPSCNYQWRKGAEPYFNGSVLKIQSVSRRDAGDYDCRVSDYTNGSATKTLAIRVQCELILKV